MRPPIIAILGHVDHGKTTLLDALRRTSLAAAEPGGITQTIDAFRVTQQPAAGNQQPAANHFTFIDTPGHEAFSKMRSRGANVADIALLVVAADDGVKPQTLESLSIIKSAGIPFIVCINKIDRQEADPVRVKTDLGKHGAAVEGFGGNIPVVEISAKTGKNLPELLEIINLVWQLQQSSLQPPASSLQQLEAPVIDSRLDPHSGPVAGVIVRQGTLRLGDHIAAGPIVGKVKSLTGDLGQRLDQALPGDPVQVLGLKSVPPVGSVLTHPHNQQFSRVAGEGVPVERPQPVNVEARTNVILKADSIATLETLTDAIARLPTPPPASLPEALRAGAAVGNGGQASLPEPKFSVVASGIGDITESDILLAVSPPAIIIGFRVAASAKRQTLAKNENVSVITDDIIYRLLERLTDLYKPAEVKPPPETGRAKIIKIFTVNETEIAGCKVESGKLAVGDSVSLIKDGVKIAEAKIKQLKSRAADIKEAKAGAECGVLLESAAAGQKLKLSQGQDIIAYQNSSIS